MIIQIARGSFSKFQEKRKLYFGECFLDVGDNVLYVGSEDKENPYKLNLEKCEATPINVGRISVDHGSHGASKQNVSESLYKEWQEFQRWKELKVKKRKLKRLKKLCLRIFK